MSDMNRVIVIGRLTREPELRHTGGGAAVASFSIAVNRTYKTNDGEKKEEVSFFNCVAWSKTAELVSQYCQKGKQVAIEGRLQQRSWEGKDGGKNSTVEIVVDTIQFLGGGAAKASDEKSEKIQDDLPF